MVDMGYAWNVWIAWSMENFIDVIKFTKNKSKWWFKVFQIIGIFVADFVLLLFLLLLFVADGGGAVIVFVVFKNNKIRYVAKNALIIV